MNDKTKRGRPTEAPLTERVYARVTEAEHARFIALGGSEWLRKQLAAAHDQGEVQRLREALEDGRRAMFAVLNQETKLRAVAKRVLDAEIKRIDAALAASTGQED